MKGRIAVSPPIAVQIWTFSWAKLKHAREDLLQYVFHTLGTKAISGAKIRMLSPGNPHEHEILADGIGDLTRRVDPLCVSVDVDFGEQLGMVAV